MHLIELLARARVELLARARVELLARARVGTCRTCFRLIQ